MSIKTSERNIFTLVGDGETRSTLIVGLGSLLPKTPPYPVRNFEIIKFDYRDTGYRYLDWFCGGLNNPYSVSKIGLVGGVHTTHGQVPGPNPDMRDTAEYKALSKLASKLSDQSQSWNAAVFLGESKQTLNMFVSTAEKLARAMKLMKQGRVKNALQVLSGDKKNISSRYAGKIPTSVQASNLWLEHRYGWLPLLKDLDDAARYLARKMVDSTIRPVRITGVGKSETTSTIEIVDNAYTTPSSVYIRASGNSRQEYECKLSVWVLPKPRQTFEELGFTDPYSVAWELAPFSFVVDWFVNVGEVLSSLHQFPQWTVLSGIKNTAYKHVRYCNNIAQTVGKGFCGYHQDSQGFFHPVWRDSYNNNAGYAVSSYRQCGRSIGWTLPTAVPVRLNLEDPFRGVRAVSAIALLRSTNHKS